MRCIGFMILIAGAILAAGRSRLGAAGPETAGGPSAPGTADPVGERTLGEVLAASPAWQRPGRAVDAALVTQLREIPPGWSLEAVYGHWCEDSVREMPILIALLDRLGGRAPAVRWVAVDRAKRRPAAVIRRLGIERVPTFVVTRHGRELGRIVERAEPSLEAALLRILRSEPAAPPPAGPHP